MEPWASSPDESDMWSGVSSAAGQLAVHLSSIRENKNKKTKNIVLNPQTERHECFMCLGSVRLKSWAAKHRAQIFGEKSQRGVASMLIYLQNRHSISAIMKNKSKMRILARNSLLIPRLNGWTLRSRLGLLCLSDSPTLPRAQALGSACGHWPVVRTAFMPWVCDLPTSSRPPYYPSIHLPLKSSSFLSPSLQSG